MNNLPNAQWERWTPQRALEVLEEQEHFGEYANRSVQPTVVLRYARDMREGAWAPNGETIIFNGRRLLDGQHRLKALVLAEVSLDLLTVRGVAIAAMPTLNIGRIRTPGDTARQTLPELVGGYYNAAAAAGRIVHMYLRYGTPTPRMDRYPTRQQLIATLREHPGVVDSIRFFQASRSGLQFRGKVTAAWHYLCGRRYPAERDAFFRNLIDGVNLSVDQPVRVLRERLLKERAAQAHLSILIISAFIVKAWNAELAGRQMRLLLFKETEEFPFLHGDHRTDFTGLEE